MWTIEDYIVNYRRARLSVSRHRTGYTTTVDIYLGGDVGKRHRTADCEVEGKETFQKNCGKECCGVPAKRKGLWKC